jgi:hypothetical protein
MEETLAWQIEGETFYPILTYLNINVNLEPTGLYYTLFNFRVRNVTRVLNCT